MKELKGRDGRIIYTAEADVETLKQLVEKVYAEGEPLIRADLRDADLSGADLREANLRDANLIRANLRDANLIRANLIRADLIRADLIRADLIRANLSDADLSDADLRDADLRGANLIRANLSGANLIRADLSGADLSGANLSGANLSGADLRDANLSEETRLPAFWVIPEEGVFIGWKSCQNGLLLKLEIPAEARRTPSLVGRKCRAEFVKVLAIYNLGGELQSESTIAHSKHDYNYTYKVGEISRPDRFDDDIRVECTQGIHFFITRKEAEEY